MATQSTFYIGRMATLNNKMSKPEIDSDGFQKVKIKRNKRQQPNKYNTKLIQLNIKIEKDKDIDVVKSIE